MLFFSRDSKVDIELYTQRINHNGGITIDVDYLRRILPFLESQAHTESVIVQDMMWHRTGLAYRAISSQTVINYLKTVECCPDYYFVNKRSRTGNDSLDAKRVIAPLMAKGYAKDFLGHYVRYRSLTQRCGRIRNIIERNDMITAESETGAPLSFLPTTASIQVNDRFAYKNEDLISLPAEMNNGIAAPKGKVLVAGDLAQSDFRIMYNLFIRSPENAEVMNAYSDKYEAIARLMHDYAQSGNVTKEPFDLDKFKRERDIYKTNILATTYGKSSDVSDEGRQFISKFSSYLMSCHRYAKMRERIVEHIELGLPLLLDSYFGGRSFLVPEKSKESETIDTALNAPIQGGTAQIVILVTNWILDKFYELGYTEDQISIFYVRHDEPIFIMDEDLLKDAWVFEEASKIQVDNWTPLELKFNFYRSYKLEDKELQAKAESFIARESHRITTYHAQPVQNEYYPLRPIFALYMQWESLENGKTVLTFYSDEKNAADYLVTETTDVDQLRNLVFAKVAAIAGRVKSEGYDGIIVYNNYINTSMHESGCCVYFKRVVNPSMNLVCTLSDNMSSIYARSCGISLSCSLSDDQKEFIKGVTKLGYIL